MSSIKAILMVCALATTAFAANVRFHNSCNTDVWLEKSALVVALKHPHFQCGWTDMLNVVSGKTRQVPAWGVEPFFVPSTYAAYDANGYNLPKMTYAEVESKVIQERKENGIPEPGRTQGAMAECTAMFINSDYINVTAVKDVYLCAPKKTVKMITVVNKCQRPVRVSVFGKAFKGNFVCSSPDYQEIKAGKTVQMPIRQFEKLYLATSMPGDVPSKPTEKPVFSGKKLLSKLTFAQVSSGSHYADGECYQSGNKYSPITLSSAIYSLCSAI
jgi:hypothetical protein